jgi:ubiquinone/menaquinone biosynthesis C-methylase UbiE
MMKKEFMYMNETSGIEKNHLKFKEEIKEYWNKRSITFDDEVGHGGADRNECLLWQDHFKQILGEKPLKILDVGTGTGFIALNLAELGHHVTGIDLGDLMLQKARTNAERRGLNATFLIGDAEDLDFPDNSFEVIICRHLFWTLLQPDQTMAEWMRILTSNGRVILIDGKKNPPKGDRPKVYTNVHEGKVYSDELIDQVQGVDVTVAQISDTLAVAGFVNITSISLDDIALHHSDQTREKTRNQPHDSEVNIVMGYV